MGGFLSQCTGGNTYQCTLVNRKDWKVQHICGYISFSKSTDSPLTHRNHNIYQHRSNFVVQQDTWFSWDFELQIWICCFEYPNGNGRRLEVQNTHGWSAIGWMKHVFWNNKSVATNASVSTSILNKWHSSIFCYWFRGNQNIGTTIVTRRIKKYDIATKSMVSTNQIYELLSTIFNNKVKNLKEKGEWIRLL